MKSNTSAMKCALAVLERTVKEAYGVTATTAEAIAAALFQVEYRGLGFLKNTSKSDKYSLVYEGVELTGYSENNSYGVFSEFGWSRSKLYRILKIAFPSISRQEFEEKKQSLSREEWFLVNGVEYPYIRVFNRLKHNCTWVRNHKWWEKLALAAKNIKQLTDYNALVSKILEEGKKVVKKVKEAVDTAVEVAVDTVVETFDTIKETISGKIAQFTESTPSQTEVIETEMTETEMMGTEDNEIVTEGLTEGLIPVSELERDIKIASPEERYPNRSSDIPERLENKEKHNIIKRISGYLLKPETLRCSSTVNFFPYERLIFLDVLTSIIQSEFPKLSISQCRDYAIKNLDAVINEDRKHPYYQRTSSTYSIFKVIHTLLAAVVREPYDYLEDLSRHIYSLSEKTLRGYMEGAFNHFN